MYRVCWHHLAFNCNCNPLATQVRRVYVDFPLALLRHWVVNLVGCLDPSFSESWPGRPTDMRRERERDKAHGQIWISTPAPRLSEVLWTPQVVVGRACSASMPCSKVLVAGSRAWKMRASSPGDEEHATLPKGAFARRIYSVLAERPLGFFDFPLPLPFTLPLPAQRSPA